LCLQIGETPQLFPALLGLSAFYLARAEYTATRELAEQLVRLAQNAQDPTLLLEAHQRLGNTLLWLGEFAPARDHLEQGSALYDPLRHRSHVSLYGHDPGMWCLFFGAWTLWHLGYPDQALKRSREALTLAQEQSHPHILANALGYIAMQHQYRQE